MVLFLRFHDKSSQSADHKIHPPVGARCSVPSLLIAEMRAQNIALKDIQKLDSRFRVRYILEKLGNAATTVGSSVKAKRPFLCPEGWALSINSTFV